MILIPKADADNFASPLGVCGTNPSSRRAANSDDCSTFTPCGPRQGFLAVSHDQGLLT